MENKTLVIAVDDSSECLLAIDFVLQHFPRGLPGSETACGLIRIHVHLVHIQPRPLETAMIAGAAGADFTHANMYAFEKELNAAAEKVLDEVFAPKAGSAGAAVMTRTIEVASDSSSHIGEAICEYAGKVEAHALVLMRHDKSTLGRILLGSVTRYCAVHSPVPVIIVPETV